MRKELFRQELFTFAFNWWAENDLLTLVVDNGVRQDFQLTSGSLQQVHVLRVRDDGLAEVNAAVYNWLFLLTFQNLDLKKL